MKQMVLLGMAQALKSSMWYVALHRGPGQKLLGHCQSQHLCAPPWTIYGFYAYTLTEKLSYLPQK